MSTETNPPAPGNLEIVRGFLNTWQIPNSTRKETDHLTAKSDLIAFTQKFMAGYKITEIEDLEQVTRLRSDLRESITTKDMHKINKWLDTYPFRIELSTSGEKGTPKVSYKSNNSFCSLILVMALDSVVEGSWERLKACPDCQWVFYDHSRNKSKVWCGMYAKSKDGRACGTIAKVNRWREKQKGKTT
ncbi:CGNR zinc finger domain-containing protein [Pseudalkalibacillus decolorationis]|uniref:CGNR zinc finger domain-containing protein n=1 Tax=Pseudalkalibacillus decolorationis TaxID=163879 RepID=UPI0021472B92|nr:CGNR zinc finger domain-containing protein [Pseudalkalibacillus decolorationis]